MKRAREEGGEEEIAVAFHIPELRAIIRGFMSLVARIQLTRTCWDYYHEDAHKITLPSFYLRAPMKVHCLKQFQTTMRELLNLEGHPLYTWLNKALQDGYARPIYKGTHIKGQCIIKYIFSCPCPASDRDPTQFPFAWHRAVLSRPTPTTWRLFMYPCRHCNIWNYWGVHNNFTIDAASFLELTGGVVDYQWVAHFLIGFPGNVGETMVCGGDHPGVACPVMR
jgi:hypothetical protein